MKKIIYISFMFLLCGCIFIYDSANGVLHIENNSDEAIYVYIKCGKVDLLPLKPQLELFHFLSMNMEDAHGNLISPHFISPDYRINAYTYGSLQIWGTRKKPRLPCEENEMTLFFLTEVTMRNHNWEEIYRNQMFVKKILLTETELKKSNWKYTYSPD